MDYGEFTDHFDGHRAHFKDSYSVVIICHHLKETKIVIRSIWFAPCVLLACNKKNLQPRYINHTQIHKYLLRVWSKEMHMTTSHVITHCFGESRGKENYVLHLYPKWCICIWVSDVKTCTDILDFLILLFIHKPVSYMQCPVLLLNRATWRKRWVWICVTFSSISAAVRLVISRFSTSSVSPRKFPEAEDSRDRRLSSSVFRVILNPFCCFVRLDWDNKKHSDEPSITTRMADAKDSDVKSK